MKPIYTYGARREMRNLTVRDLRACKGHRKLSQVTVSSAEEATAAVAAGIDTLVCDFNHFPAVRQGAATTFLTTNLPAPQFVSHNDILRAAITVMEAGGDAVFTSRALSVIESLTREGFPVMSHLGMNPRRSTFYGGPRILGKTADEALALLEDARRLESAGAFAVEAELIAEEVLATISTNTSLVTFSLGSGAAGDVIFLYMDDICGEQSDIPRHAKTYGDVGRIRRLLAEERVVALRRFHAEATSGAFPTPAHSGRMDPTEHQKFCARLGA